jgi:hypothetical protein
MPAKRRSKWTRPKQSKMSRLSTAFSDAEIEESEESFSELACVFVSEVTPTNDEVKKHTAALNDQLIQLSQDFAVFSMAFDEIYFSSELKAGTIQKARLALEVFGATLDVVDSLHSME